MHPEALAHEEAVALLALARALVLVDGDVSTAEHTELREIGMDLGTATWTKAQEQLDDEPSTLERALELADAVERPDARELILTVLTDLARSDGEADAEADAIGRLREHWGED